MDVMTVTASSDNYRMEVLSCKIGPVVARIAEFGGVTQEKSAKSRSVGIMATGAFAFCNGRMDIRILKFGFLMAAVTEVGYISYEFHTAFLLRMLLILHHGVARVTTYGESRVIIF
jgi:hypothetical protein